MSASLPKVSVSGGHSLSQTSKTVSIEESVMAESISEDISGSMGMIESMIDKSMSDPSKKFQSSSHVVSMAPTENIGASRSKVLLVSTY